MGVGSPYTHEMSMIVEDIKDLMHVGDSLKSFVTEHVDADRVVGEINEFLHNLYEHLSDAMKEAQDPPASPISQMNIVKSWELAVQNLQVYFQDLKADAKPFLKQDLVLSNELRRLFESVEPLPKRFRCDVR